MNWIYRMLKAVAKLPRMLDRYRDEVEEQAVALAVALAVAARVTDGFQDAHEQLLEREVQRLVRWNDVTRHYPKTRDPDTGKLRSAMNRASWVRQSVREQAESLIETESLLNRR